MSWFKPIDCVVPKKSGHPSYWRPVVIHGKQYESIRHAARGLGCSTTKIYGFLGEKVGTRKKEHQTESG